AHGAAVDLKQERTGDDRAEQGGREVDERLEAPAFFAEEQEQRRRQQGQHDGHHDEVRQKRAHGFSSVPSTWSVPLNPREARSTTRNSAVVAKPMTMAVSTRDWGSGSV